MFIHELELLNDVIHFHFVSFECNANILENDGLIRESGFNTKR